MTLPTSSRTWSVVAFAAALAACGGGESPDAGAARFAGQMADAASSARAASAQPDAATGLRARLLAAATSHAPLAAAPAAVTADMVLDWAEFKFPDLFPKALAVKFPSVDYEGQNYNARAYSGAWGTRYLGITPDGRIFGLGDFTEQRLKQFDTIAFWSAQVAADQCAVNPGSCPPASPAGPLNDCTMPAAQALATGMRFVGTYAISGSATGEFRIDSTVQGPGTFEGQPAIREFSRVIGSITAEGFTSSTTTESTTWYQDAGNGFTRTLGAEATITTGGVTVPGVGVVGGSTSTSRTVFTPPSVNVEYSIQPGQSIGDTITVVTTLDGVATPPASSYTLHTFVTRENINVRGRTYATCRYTEGDGSAIQTTSWFVRGNGVGVRTVSTSVVDGQTQTETVELVEGTINGAPI
jgi:hypothetical protein